MITPLGAPAPGSEAQRLRLLFPGPSLLEVPREASALVRPCQLHGYHSPVVVRTEGHHRHPVYLQNRVYGEIRDGELLWLCGIGHDAIHSWLPWALGEGRKPDVRPGAPTMDEVERTYEWYRSLAA